jgi:sucrose-6F-phosphate phosphohydrolase
MIPNEGNIVRLFATDIEDTIIGDAVAERKFRDTWESLEAKARPLLAYNSGRSIADIQWLVLERRIPCPEFILGSLGTEIHDPLDARVAEDYCANLSAGWNRMAVLDIVGAIPGAQLQPPEYQNSHKVSCYWHRATAAEVFRLEYRLREAGLDVNVSYVAGVFLDVVPRGAGKGNALAWLCQRIGIPLDQVVVAGAGGNNCTMFALPGVRTIAIGNSSRDLLAKVGYRAGFLSAEKHGDGVLAGLEFFAAIAHRDKAVA